MSKIGYFCLCFFAWVAEELLRGWSWFFGKRLDVGGFLIFSLVYLAHRSSRVDLHHDAYKVSTRNSSSPNSIYPWRRVWNPNVAFVTGCFLFNDCDERYSSRSLGNPQTVDHDEGRCSKCDFGSYLAAITMSAPGLRFHGIFIHFDTLCLPEPVNISSLDLTG